MECVRCCNAGVPLHIPHLTLYTSSFLCVRAVSSTGRAGDLLSLMPTIAQPVLCDGELKRWEQRELVESLRRRGLSYREIMVQLPFPLSKSTISAWCRDIELTPQQLDRLDALYRQGHYRGRLLGSKATQRQRSEEVRAIRTRARSEVLHLRKNDLWLAGLMLYWAEGSKTHNVSVANSDHHLMTVVMRWFREFCGVPDETFRVQLHLHSGQDQVSIQRFWAEVLQVPLAQFIKVHVKAEGTGHRKKLLYRGTVRVYISNRNLLHRILGWIEEVGRDFGAASSIGRAPAS